ncbi:GNAT family acetyltransferase [Catellatospora sp. IY07-71]|uniref:GNAT family N-acetyltransferase n=1 Tax=Catellatospora sp. IY07-71 TaxID=2728827 RepID=UPI001BB4053A|nr:GNAT family N-acetyltransferase [Catellatospora sp. IY07-71]BCJ73273.1 GNAT family acetyltransferase [Catellatospora sp. IY07-71]
MSDLDIRRAVAADVPVIVAMLADDPLGATREGDPDDPAYARAFAEIDADPHQLLAVAVRGGEVVGTLQLTVIPGLSRRGTRRALIEAVRVRADQRGQGTGRQLVEWAIDTARARGCGMVQLTTDRSRTDAHRFYESLGFTGSHLGMKLAL